MSRAGQLLHRERVPLARPQDSPFDVRLRSPPAAGVVGADPRYYEDVEARAVPGRQGASRWGWVALGASIASAIGYAAQWSLDYVSKPAYVGEIEFYGLFVSLAFLALIAGAVAALPVPGRRSAAWWGWVAAGATILSAIGYVVQTIFDHVREPALLAEIEFYGLFLGFALVALVAGAVSVVTGWRRADLTMRLGFIAVAYALLAQLIQSLWD